MPPLLITKDTHSFQEMTEESINAQYEPEEREYDVLLSNKYPGVDWGGTVGIKMLALYDVAEKKIIPNTNNIKIRITEQQYHDPSLLPKWKPDGIYHIRARRLRWERKDISVILPYYVSKISDEEVRCIPLEEYRNVVRADVMIEDSFFGKVRFSYHNQYETELLFRERKVPVRFRTEEDIPELRNETAEKMKLLLSQLSRRDQQIRSEIYQECQKSYNQVCLSETAKGLSEQELADRLILADIHMGIYGSFCMCYETIPDNLFFGYDVMVNGCVTTDDYYINLR